MYVFLFPFRQLFISLDFFKKINLLRLESCLRKMIFLCSQLNYCCSLFKSVCTVTTQQQQQPPLRLCLVVFAGWGVSQRPAAAARGALLGPFRLHVHSAGRGRRPAEPQPRSPPRTCQLHPPLVHISVQSSFRVVV